MSSFQNVLTGSDELRAIDLTVKNLTLTGDLIVEQTVETIEIDLLDSFNDAVVGTSVLYIYKLGNMVTVSCQSFVLDSALADVSSFIYTDYELESRYTPINTIAGANNQYFGYFSYTFPLATTTPTGRFGLAFFDTDEPQFRFYGPETTGGFNTATTITAFNCSLTYLTEEA